MDLEVAAGLCYTARLWNFLHFHRHDIISHPLSVQLLYAHPVRQAANNNVNNTEEIMF